MLFLPLPFQVFLEELPAWLGGSPIPSPLGASLTVHSNNDNGSNNLKKTDTESDKSLLSRVLVQVEASAGPEHPGPHFFLCYIFSMQLLPCEKMAALAPASLTASSQGEGKAGQGMGLDDGAFRFKRVA